MSEDLKATVRWAIREEIVGMLRQVWLKEGGVEQIFRLIPHGAVPPEITPELVRECAHEVAAELES